jgi:hypothetical protein
MSESGQQGPAQLGRPDEGARTGRRQPDRQVAAGRGDRAETQDMNKLAFSILASGYLCRVYTDAHRPVFMPLWNYAINQGGPDPDYVYSTAEIDAHGVYEISGYRGTSRFVEITQQSFDMMHPSDMEQGSPVPTINDLDDLQLDENGYFKVVLSAERPPGYSGDWWELHPGARRLLMRKCACDWDARSTPGWP